jgi:hypothetical protein
MEYTLCLSMEAMLTLIEQPVVGWVKRSETNTLIPANQYGTVTWDGCHPVSTVGERININVAINLNPSVPLCGAITMGAIARKLWDNLYIS